MGVFCPKIIFGVAKKFYFELLLFLYILGKITKYTIILVDWNKNINVHYNYFFYQLSFALQKETLKLNYI